MPSIRERVAQFLFGDVIDQRIKAATVDVEVREGQRAGWEDLTGSRMDRPWGELLQDQRDALEAWRRNFFVRRLVTLHRTFVLGGGVSVSSSDPVIDAFIADFWHHRQNHMPSRLGPMLNDLMLYGELFPVLFTNDVDRMSYVRFIPASQIREIKTAENDYEHELEYVESDDPIEPRTWHAEPDDVEIPQMLHFAVNRPLGATRGEGDLTPILPWARRYTEWLKDRVRINRIRTRQGILLVQVSDDSLVEAKRAQVERQNPLESGSYIYGPGEEVTMPTLNINANDAESDGKVLRLAIAAGANSGLHYLGEGEGTNYATAKEMGEPTTRFYSERQGQFVTMLETLVTAAYNRFAGQDLTRREMQLVTTVEEVTRADNEGLAAAAAQIAMALQVAKTEGWIDNTTASRLFFKFAGELMTEEEIQEMLNNATTA
jgi:hypothetical protein